MDPSIYGVGLERISSSRKSMGRVRIGLIAVLCGNIPACTNGASPATYDSAHPFRSVAGWLVKTDSHVGNEDSVKRALLMLSKTQLMTKGVDGAAFHLSSKTGGAASRSNVTAELEKLHQVYKNSKAQEGKPNIAAAKLVSSNRPDSSFRRCQFESQRGKQCHIVLCARGPAKDV
jgi:hypothetical protein